MEKYNISKASKFLNISNELIRHYERLGLIEPERGENGYRFFSYRDIDKLQGIRRYRNMNFSLEDMDKLIYTADYEQVGELFKQSLDRVKEQIVWYQELQNTMEKLIGDWQQLDEMAGKCEITVSRDILRVNLRCNDVLDETIVTEEMVQWMEKMPVVFISPYFKKDAVLNGVNDVEFGYGIEIDAFKRLGLKHIAAEQYIRSCKCVTTVISSHGDGGIGGGSLDFVVKYCQDRNLTISGDAWGITIANCSREGETWRYHKVFVPIE